MKISVFGGSEPREGDPAYSDALRLGRILAERGHTVLTGGYIGTMEAVSRGAFDAGGHVIGVTCSEIEHWRKIPANRWVQEEWKRETLLERMHDLIGGCDAALALPGGAGTLTEIALMWNMMIIETLHRRPLILIGDGWQSVFGQVFTGLARYTTEPQRSLLRFAADIDAAVQLVESA
ncbi:MAG TPA: LOG family protein [Anaerolineales bacterium]